MYRCICDCGNEVIVAGINLRNGKTKSCGCLRGEVAKETFTTHGLSKERVYDIWKSMIQRCEHDGQNNHRYKGRGIKVCDEWHDPIKFKQWALENGYSDDKSIDRIDNDGDYCPENCRWATPKEQSNNTSQNVYLNNDKEEKTISEWADELGIKYTTMVTRHGLFKSETDPKLFEPVFEPLKIECDGVVKTVKEWADYLDKSTSCIYYRYKNNKHIVNGSPLA